MSDNVTRIAPDPNCDSCHGTGFYEERDERGEVVYSRRCNFCPPPPGDMDEIYREQAKRFVQDLIAHGYLRRMPNGHLAETERLTRSSLHHTPTSTS